MLNIIGHRKIFLFVSLTLVGLSLLSMALFRFKLGVDFSGGSLWQVKIPATTPAAVKNFFESDLGFKGVSVAYDAPSETYAVTLTQLSESNRQADLQKLKTQFGSGVQDVDFWSLSPSVSSELASRALWAIFLVLIGVSFYIAYAFRKVSRPVSSWKYGLITLGTLFHDVIIPAGVYAALGKFFGASADTNFVVALLVVMGFSVHDTIVVFDRTRENLSLNRGKIDLKEIVNRSVNETMRRSINTSLALVLVLLALYFLGPQSLKYFVLTLLIGTIVGTYSSIFVASPLLVMTEKKNK
ncbi:MAG TPA: protein translocase subunit SecF [Candidatus Tyrphobacter sp.]|nr:protein translocase subunit SecF [Candidatus Tyrphobacter sp.]